MLILRCRHCSSTFKIKEEIACPNCGEIVDEKVVSMIYKTIDQLTSTVHEVQDLGWDLFLSTDNTFIPTRNYPDGTLSIPYRLFLNE